MIFTSMDIKTRVNNRDSSIRYELNNFPIAHRKWISNFSHSSSMHTIYFLLINKKKNHIHK